MKLRIHWGCIDVGWRATRVVSGTPTSVSDKIIIQYAKNIFLKNVKKYIFKIFIQIYLRAKTARQGFLLCNEGSLIQSSGPMWTKSRWENCLAKSSKAIQNSPSFRTRTLSNSLSRSDRESHSQERSLQGPFHSPLPQGFRSLTRWVSPKEQNSKWVRILETTWE